MNVHRRTPLPTAAVRGQLLVAEQVVAPTLAALQASSGQAGRHEGLVLWLGRQCANTSMVMAMITPAARTGPDYVFLDEAAVAGAARAARGMGLGVIAQVHSHPGSDTRHSDGDDQLVLMPFENMFSLVVARYGDGPLLPAGGAGLHQYQDGIWRCVVDDDAMRVVGATAVCALPGTQGRR
ncbi:Mov34/MPN/PAD-1 family protein [Mycobacterium sp. BMJ-28]